jgi:hypothetical protein
MAFKEILMRMRRTLAYLVFASCVVVFVVKNRAAEVQGEVRSGDWTVSKSDSPGKVEFSLIEHHHGGQSSHQSDWSASLFQGVDFSKPGRQEVHFTITRDAGKIDCEGYLNNGEGAGLFHFQPDPNYPREMQAVGFSIDEEKQFNMAVMDVTVEFAKQMKSEQLSGLDTDKLIAFRIFGVNHEFIQALRAEGLKTPDADKLVAFRIHGVSPEMIRSVRQMGYSPDEDKLIAMRIHGATPEWMAELKQRGYDHVDLDKLIAFRIHGVSPEFIGKVQSLGYSHPAPDELIAMRIHNVTPEYISDMKARGIHDLSIDQLVSMRIHGID